MTNDRLRDALQRNGLGYEDLASALEVDAKTVERWVRQGRNPYPKYRRQIALRVGEAEDYLWPGSVSPERTAEVSSSEVVAVYPHRHLIPRDVWTRLFDKFDRELDILVYAGLFLTENPGILDTLRSKARSGAQVRFLFGDPKCREVVKRSTEEGIGASTIGAKIRNTIAFFGPINSEAGVEMRQHKTPLYNSIYRFDDEMLVNTHVLGHMAAHSPVLHLKQLDGGTLFNMYATSFDSVWGGATSIGTSS